MSTIPHSELLHLPVAERLRLIEELWESVAAEASEAPDRLPLSDAQRRVIASRSEAHRRHPDDVVPLDEALARIERSLA